MYLDGALSQLNAFQALHAFSKKEFNNENIEFLMLVRWLNPGLGRAAINLFPSFCVTVLHQTKYIFKTYVAKKVGLNYQDNPKWINLPANLQNELEVESVGEMDKHTFDRAYKNIFDLVNRDLWYRFVINDVGRALGAEVEPARFHPAAVPAAPVAPPPIIFNAPAVAAAPVVTAAAPVVPVAPRTGFRRPVLPNHAAPVVANHRVPPPQPGPLPPTPAAVARLQPPLPPIPVAPAVARHHRGPVPVVPPAQAAAALAAAAARDAASNAPLPRTPDAPAVVAPPLPPVFIVPPESVGTRARGQFGRH
jgi:hypothetical protein